HFSLDPQRLHPAFGELARYLNQSGQQRKYQLTVANRLWGQKDYGFLPDFTQLIKGHYGAGLQELDFANATEQARKTINAWVEKQTNDKIKDLIPEGVLQPDTRLVLTNAIYFKAPWEEEFFKGATKTEDFHLSASKKVKAPLMHRQDLHGFLDGGDFKAL